MLHRFSAFTLPLVLLLSCALLPQAAREQHSNAPRQEQQLRELARTSPEKFARNNYDYLLARLLEQRGADAEAATFYQKVIARNSPLAGYALWHRAELARAAGDFKEEQAQLQRLLAQFPDSLLRERALLRLSDSLFKTGQYQAVINTVRSFGGTRRDLLPKIGEAQLALKQTEAARATFQAALGNSSSDDTALRAILGLDRLEENSSGQLTEAESLRRARIYQFNRYFAEARKHWLALVNNFPASKARAEALFSIGRGYQWDSEFANAAKWFEQAHTEFPKTDEGELGFYYVGHCHQFSDNADRAIARYEEFLREYPQSEYFGYAHLNAIDTLRSAGRLDEALQWAARAQTNVNNNFIVVTALFQEARIRLTREDAAGALQVLNALRQRNLNVRGLIATTNYAEVAFLRARCLELLGRFDEAITEYLALNETRNGAAGYYGAQATERLRALATNARAKNIIATRREAFLTQARAAHAQGNAVAAKAAANQALRLIDGVERKELLDILRAAYAKLPGYQLPPLGVASVGRQTELPENGVAATGTSHLTIANELLFLKLVDEGAAELAAAATTNGPTVAYYCARGDCASRTIKAYEPTLNTLPEDYRVELLPREWAEVFYPTPFREALAREAVPRGVDPRFVLSIIRQESRYDPRVKSAAAARGMLQFIPSTAAQIAAQLKLSDFEQNDLYEPHTAMQIGAQYMKNLFDEFGSPQAVAASYNGSEDSVRRWLARSKSTEVDRLVSETVKRETKDYVYKVMNNLLAYRALYPADWPGNGTEVGKK